MYAAKKMSATNDGNDRGLFEEPIDIRLDSRLLSFSIMTPFMSFFHPLAFALRVLPANNFLFSC